MAKVYEIYDTCIYYSRHDVSWNGDDTLIKTFDNEKDAIEFLKANAIDWQDFYDPYESGDFIATSEWRDIGCGRERQDGYYYLIRDVE